ncbi:Flp family type IVb pilin [Sandarakinorhabdus oryzae]|uniref:Flp family type IVb pilin n=1 Tax=Sandarakinorhabdus oryzae TaxID=2675220 RepID=UPI0012E17F15|nr:Flp family type IVb pilin [Sandarakinorhabdus oryzae]
MGIDAMIFWSFIACKSGASAAEYALIVASLLGPLLLGLDAFGGSLFAMFEAAGGIFSVAKD